MEPEYRDWRRDAVFYCQGCESMVVEATYPRHVVHGRICGAVVAIPRTTTVTIQYDLGRAPAAEEGKE